MEAAEVEAILERSESALASDPRANLKALGFWRAVEAVKRDRDWRGRYASRIASIDRRAFLGRVRLAFPLQIGVAALTVGTAVGLALLAVAFTLPPDLAGVAVLLGASALIGATHDLAHLAVGALAGIRFTHFYSAGPPRPQPGLKIDYVSYLTASPRARAWMHASGAIVSKLVPFVCVPVALGARAPWWSTALLLLIGAGQILTDVLFSTKTSDWKRFRREMRLAR